MCVRVMVYINGFFSILNKLFCYKPKKVQLKHEFVIIIALRPVLPYSKAFGSSVTIQLEGLFILFQRLIIMYIS